MPRLILQRPFHAAPQAVEGCSGGDVKRLQIGVAERALELMCQRLNSRVAFGRKIFEQGVWRERIAEARIQIDTARLLTLKAAYMMDTVGNKGAQAEIAMIKVLAPNVAQQVLDWAIQAHGAAGRPGDQHAAMGAEIGRMGFERRAERGLWLRRVLGGRRMLHHGEVRGRIAAKR